MIGVIPRGLRYMAAGAFFFSIMSLLAKTAGGRIPTQEMVLARGAVMTAMSYLALRRAGVSPWGERQRVLLLIRGVLGFTALSCFFFAVVRLPLADATVIHFTAPVWPLMAITRSLSFLKGITMSTWPSWSRS